MIMPYIPALVFTLYDGYYIYSPNLYTYEQGGITKTGYEHILKPYIYYSARYKSGATDIVVNYSLDNYITIYGQISGIGYVSKSGYLVNLDRIEKSGDMVTGYRIKDSFTLNTNVIESLKQTDELGNTNTKQSDSMKKYYQEAYEFTNWVLNVARLQDVVKPANALRSDGTKYDQFNNNQASILNINNNNDPEEKSSLFVQHKQEVIKLSVQENLSNAIAVYNEHSSSMGTNANFMMPKLTDDDWEKILTNVNMISFMQGIPAGTKLYNNYSIVTSTQNKQYINPNSLYFIDNTGNYHRINCPVLQQNVNAGSSIIGYKTIDFRKYKKSIDKTKYYYKHTEYACYECIVNSLDDDIAVKELNNTQLQAYYNALAREKYDLEKITKIFK